MGEKRATVLVTGGTSDIAKATIKMMYDQGCNMIITDVPERLDELEGYAQSIHKLTGGDIYSFGLNLEDVPAIRDFVQNIDAGIEINYLINVAGINILKNFFSWELEEWEKVLRINATGTFFLTQVVVERMIVQKKKGNIVFVSSQHGVVANHDRIPYCLSKGMLIQLTKALALELAPHDIRVNCVSPTFVLTERNQSFLYNSYFQKEALEQIPLNKYALPVDVANGIAFLMSEEANMITGHNLVIDGGWTIK